MRTNDETENELENRTEGVEDEEPGNQNATTTRTFPTRTVATKPKSRVPIAKPGGRAMPKGKFVAGRPSSKVARSSTKNRSGKKYRSGGPGKQPPTVAQKAKSFGGV